MLDIVSLKLSNLKSNSSLPDIVRFIISEEIAPQKGTQTDHYHSVNLLLLLCGCIFVDIETVPNLEVLLEVNSISRSGSQ